jgi:hypothetical protein
MGGTGHIGRRLSPFQPSRIYGCPVYGGPIPIALEQTEQTMHDPDDQSAGRALARPQSCRRSSESRPPARPATCKSLVDQMSLEERLGEVANLLWTGLKRRREREFPSDSRGLCDQNALDKRFEESGHGPVPLAMREAL